MNFPFRFYKRGRVFDHDDDRWFEYVFLKSRGFDRAVEDALIRLWNPMRSYEVLDVGCGSGRFLKWLNSVGHRVSGVELSGELVRKARKRLPKEAKIFQCDAISLPFADSQYDVVFFVFSLEFMAQPERALMEGIRIARNMVFVVSLNPYSPVFWRDKLIGRVAENPLSECSPLGFHRTRRLLNCYLHNTAVMTRYVVWKNRSGSSIFPFDEYVAPVILIKIEKALRVDMKMPVSIVQNGIIASNTATLDWFVRSTDGREVQNNEGIHAL